MLLIAIPVAGAIFTIISGAVWAQQGARAQFINEGIRTQGTVLAYESLPLSVNEADKILFAFSVPGMEAPIHTEQMLAQGTPQRVIDAYPPGTSLEIAYLKNFPKLAVPVPFLQWCLL
jgi:hypothetical protein